MNRPYMFLLEVTLQQTLQSLAVASLIADLDPLIAAIRTTKAKSCFLG